MDWCGAGQQNRVDCVKLGENGKNGFYGIKV